jgi:hypothetical protein
MNDLVQTVGLGDALDSAGIEWRGRNFEDVYSALYGDPDNSDLASELDNSIAEYFGGMQLLERATIYDYLVLGLRSKDVVATFNWDPFLFQAYLRNRHLADMPTLLHLHGCAIIGVCYEHRKQGLVGRPCPVCHQSLLPVDLLYPIGDKDYGANTFIETQWNLLQKVLEHAFLFTIFGYSAPPSDYRAIQLMKTAWGDVERRQFEEIEFIDIKPTEDLTETWDDFIHTHHFTSVTSFFDSFLARYPRRSCEAMYAQLIDAKWCDNNPVPSGEIPLKDLQDWYSDLIDHESAA